MGPFHAWPTGSGFEHFYGFLGGETNQYAPAIYQDTVPIEPDRTAEEGYHFTEDMTDHAIDWIRQQKALMPDKPFFVYFAPGATHAPHHVRPEWSDKYKGDFDDGWDASRERTFARQKELGVIPPDAELTERPEEIPAWDDMPDDLKPVLARQMEVYAGFLEHTDHHVGRLIDALDDIEVLDSTLVYYVIGDNGASAEGTPNGCFNELVILNGALGLETTEFMVSRIDDFGTPDAYNHYAVGWAHAMDTPYQWTKQVASHWGGTRNGVVVHWPKGIIAQYRRGVTHSVRELEWKQAEMARTLVNGMLRDESGQAMAMLDWEEGRTYEIAPGTKVRIVPRDVPVALEAALRVNGARRTGTQRFITDRYDRFLFQGSQLQTAVRSGLMRQDHVRFPLEWYVENRLCPHKKVLLAYIAENSTIESRQFFESLDAWRRCASD
jgi:hypothetical protein